MKKLTLILMGVLALTFQSKAHGYSYINSYADAIVFDEMGITFAVYPDGEFDFYFANSGATTVSNGYVNATFNSGYNYNPYVQYDDYGAVVQVENVPVFYDWYGRVSQVGDVQISYNNRRVCRVGGMNIYYNGYGRYAYHTGFINTWNPYFVYRPFYVAFVRPTMCFVNLNPYRRYYRPVRYTYYHPYVSNPRPCYATIGHTYTPSGNVVTTTQHRYSQTPGYGQTPVVRQRTTVTKAMEAPRPTAVNRGTMSQHTAATSNYGRTGSVPSNGSNYRTAPTNGYNNGRVNQTSVSRNAATTQARPVQTAPARSNAATRSTGSSRPTVVAPNRSGSTSGSMSRGSSTSVRTAPARTTQSSGSSRGSLSSSSSMNRGTSTHVQQSSGSRNAVSKPSSSAPSRTTASRPASTRSTGSVSKAPSRSSSSTSMNKGGFSKGSAGRK
ncbi:MAG: hypothetical protein GC178_09095 [Flavobacteriales bacterium]|nr:hypothetical protein [Flavobacteriales bacterium]